MEVLGPGLYVTNHGLCGYLGNEPANVKFSVSHFLSPLSPLFFSRFPFPTFRVSKCTMNFKLTKVLIRHFTRGDTKIADKHMKKWTTLSVVRVVRATLNCHKTPTRLTKTQTRPCQCLASVSKHCHCVDMAVQNGTAGRQVGIFMQSYTPFQRVVYRAY